MSTDSPRTRILARLRSAGLTAVPGRSSATAGPSAWTGGNSLAHFKACLQQAGAQVVEAMTPMETGTALHLLLRNHMAEPALIRTPDARIARLAASWRSPHPQLLSRGFEEGDMAVASHALAGVAETGSLVIPSETSNPGTLNFLPEVHIILLARQQVVRSLDDVWPLVRAFPERPRAVHFITGPSRTADIEQTIQIGAHGPRHLYVVLYPGPALS